MSDAWHPANGLKCSGHFQPSDTGCGYPDSAKLRLTEAEWLVMSHLMKGPILIQALARRGGANFEVAFRLRKSGSCHFCRYEIRRTRYLERASR